MITSTGTIIIMMKSKAAVAADQEIIAAAADAAEAFKRIGDVPKHFITHIHEEIEAARDRMEGQLWQ